MSDPTEPVPVTPPAESTPQVESTPPDGSGDAGTVWKVLTAVFAVAAIGFAVWAFSLNSDAQSSEDASTGQIATLQEQVDQLTEQNEALESEKAQLEQDKAALEQGDQEQAAADKKLIDDAVAGLGVPADKLDVQAQQVTDAGVALETAQSALDAATDELTTAQAERDVAEALFVNAQLCAAGSINAVTLLSDGDATNAAASLDTVAPACTVAFADANQPS